MFVGSWKVLDFFKPKEWEPCTAALLGRCSNCDVTTSLFDRTLLHTGDVMDPGVVEALLEHSLCLIVDWIQIWGIWLPHQFWGENCAAFCAEPLRIKLF